MSAVMMRMRVARMIAAGCLATVAACKGDDTAQAASGPATISVSPENIVIVAEGRLESGPAISGSLAPEQSAVIRAEVGGAVLATYVEAGQRVVKGTRLAKIDDTGIQDSYLSARSGVTSAQSSADLAKREEARAVSLAEAGAIADRDVEGARRANIAAQAQLADARARLALAEKQLANTIINAPFAGVVSDRKVSAGDVVSPGGEMFTVVDPSSMRLEASVPAAELSAVRMGLPVSFTVNGYPGRVFTGKITRINPTADPMTRQVRIFASIPNVGQALVGGLFAEGRVAAESHVGPTVPVEALDQTGTTPAVMQIRNGTVEKVDVQVGILDGATERVELTAGVAVGDTLLLGAARSITPNTPVKVTPRDAPAERPQG
jgi:RND family efflux transporter MFP subunit